MNKEYYRHSRLSERKFRHLIKCFAEDKTAKKTSDETKLDRKSVNSIFMRIRRRILEASSQKQPDFSLQGIKTSLPYFVAQTEKDCKKYSRHYKSKVLIILFDKELFRAYIIYAETNKIFDEILKNLSNLRYKTIQHFGFYDLSDKPQLINFGLKRQSFKEADAYLYEFGLLKERSGWLFSYFFHRTKKFKGINSDNFILHLKETEWRANIIPIAKELEGISEKSRIISQNLYEELLEILRKNRL